MMPKFRLLIFIAGLWAVTPWAMAQRASAWRTFRASDGLADSVVLSVNTGPRGKIWLKHPGGESVSWLDGYGAGTLPSPGPGNYRIYESAGGQIWSLTGDGLQLFKDDHWVSFPLGSVGGARFAGPDSAQPLVVCPVILNRALYVGTNGLFEFNADNQDRPESHLLRAADQTRLQRFNGMLAARDGGLWISGLAGIARLPGPLREIKNSTPWTEHLISPGLALQNVRELVEDGNGGVTALADSTATNRQSIVHFDGRVWTVLPVMPPDRTLRAWHGNGDIWWALTSTALYQWQSGQSDFTVNDEVSARRYFDAELEPGGVFWLATSDGLFRRGVFAWRTPPGMPGSVAPANSLIEDAADRICVASPNSLELFESNQWRSFNLPQTTPADVRGNTGGFAMTNGNILVDAGGQLMEFTPSLGQFNRIPHHPESRVIPIGQLRDGSVCVRVLDPAASRDSNRLEVFDGTRFHPFPVEIPAASGNEPLLLQGSQPGSFWISSSKGLLWRHDNKWDSFPRPDATTDEAPACLLEFAEGRIWVGIRETIWEFNGKAWRFVRNGFDRVNSMIKARDGSIWVATDSGVHRFVNGFWAANGLDEGLPSSSVRDIHEDRSGRIWAATTRGVCVYHPEADADPPRTTIHDLPEPRNTVREGNVISVTFDGRDRWKHTSPNRLLFSYKLDQGEWSIMQEERIVVLPDLKPGKHFFRVRSVDRNWNVETDPPTLEFAIELPWYKEARLLAIVTAGLIVTVFFAGIAVNRHLRLTRSYAEVEAKVALRTSQLEVASQELLQSQKMNALGTLAAGIAHDFNNILSIIKGSAQIIEENLDNPAKVRTRTDRIKTVVDQGAGIVNAMLGFSRQTGHELTLCSVNEIVGETIKLLGDRFVRGLEVRFEAGKGIPEVPASKDYVQQILLNFIFNASDAMNGKGRVVLSTRVSQQLPQKLALVPAVSSAYVFISAQDFGTGISPEIIQRIFEPFFTTKAMSSRRGTGLGLSMAYELAHQMDCGLAVESVVGHGSTFSLIVPIRSIPGDSPDAKT